MPNATSEPYDVYYSSGTYDLRYPKPNPTVLDHILRLTTPDTHLIDFGCGSGRYLVPLRQYLRCAAGFDICQTALDILQERLAQTSGAPVALLGPDLDSLADHVARHGKPDLIVCLFGVLAHMTPRSARSEILSLFRSLLRPGGRLLVSVPNRHRRFAREQREATPGAEISYRRMITGGSISLPYQLFDPAMLSEELSSAGFLVEGAWAESVLPESWVTKGRLAGLTDSLLTPLCPVRWGYGILMQARIS
ncbi:MAG: class I SAM-dependent methyltransferase [Roseinatronobacter sp.]|nr:class I SAM-dependent methyltransferase [Roseinatronobacter sp.]